MRGSQAKEKEPSVFETSDRLTEKRVVALKSVLSAIEWESSLEQQRALSVGSEKWVMMSCLGVSSVCVTPECRQQVQQVGPVIRVPA